MVSSHHCDCRSPDTQAIDRDTHLSNTDNSLRLVILNMFPWRAQFERELISAQTVNDAMASLVRVAPRSSSHE